MQVIEPTVRIDYDSFPAGGSEALLKKIERIGRTCYKSEDKITDDSYKPFIKRLVDRGHEAMLEHVSVTAYFRVDRGVSHELVRHRLASFAQESTRYCNYKDKDIEFVRPSRMDKYPYELWVASMLNAEDSYKALLHNGCSPQQARAALPNSLATDIVVTANLREWRTIFKLRCAKDAHPDMRYIMLQALDKMYVNMPVVFEDLYARFKEDIDAVVGKVEEPLAEAA